MTPSGHDNKRRRRKRYFASACLAAVRAKTPGSIAAADLRLVAQALWQMAGNDSRVRLAKLWDWVGKSQRRGGGAPL